MINCNRRDGSARAVNEVAERLAKRHTVHLFARQAEDLDVGSLRWHRVPGPGWPEVADFASFHVLANRLIDPKAFDIVHSIGCNTLRANVITIQNIQPAKEPLLKRLAGADRVSAGRRFTRWLYLRVTCRAEWHLYTARPSCRVPLFLPVSHGVERELRQHYDIGRATVRIVPNAADTKKFKPLNVEGRQNWRAKNGLAENDITLIFVGGEWARKGLDLAIRAISLIPDNRVKLFVAGDDPGRERFGVLARELGVGERVRFGGFRSDIPTALGASDAFLFPSWYEAFSLATIEAAACGLPVFATKINGAEDFIQPGINGQFIQPTPEAIADVLRDALKNAASLRAMGESGRSLVTRFYTWDRVALATEEAYRDYLDNSVGNVADA